MKRHLTILALIFTVLLATTLVRAEAAPTFSVGTAEVPLDGEVTIDITIADMPAAGLNTFGCTVTFTPSEVEVTGVAAGEWYDPEDNMLFLDNIDNTGGTVTFGGGMATGEVGSGTLATLTFKGKSITASSAVTLSVFEAKDSTWNDIESPAVENGSIEVYQQYTLTVSASEGGTTEPTTGTHQYKAGTEVDLTATPNEGYRFYKWTIDGTDVSDAITKVTMDKGKTAQAYFYLPEVTTIEVSGNEGITIPGLGETAVEKTYTATLKDQHGIEMTGAVTWSVEGNPAGVTIENGVLKVTDGAKDVTEVTVKATYGTVTGTLSVSLVRATPILTSIAITGDSTVIIPVARETTTAQYTATGKDQYGTLIAEQPTFTWSLATPVTGISIDSEGKVTVGDTAVDGSSFTIKATSGEVTGSKEVTLKRATPILTSIAIEGLDSVIIPVAGETTTAQYTATGKDQYGTPIAEQPTFTWSLATPVTGISIDSEGKVTVGDTAVDGSSFTIKATSGEGEGTITRTLEVTLERATSVVTSIEITTGPDSVIIPVPEAAAITERYTATAKDQYGTVMSDVTFTWSVSGESTTGVTIESGVLTVTDKAVVGTVTVKATYGTGEDAVTGTLSVSLVHAASVLTTIEITGDSTVIIPVAGETTTAQYTAIGKDQYGAEMTTEFTWSLAAPVTGVAVNTETGKVTVYDAAVDGSSFTIKATSGEVTGSKTVGIVLDVLAPSSIEVSGTEKIVVIDTGATLYQYNAKVFDQYKDEMVEETVTWSVGGDNTTGISIDVNGRVTIDGSKVVNGQTFIVTATSTSVGSVTGQLTVALQVPVGTSTIVTPDQGLTEIAGPGGSRLVIPAGAVTGETPVTISMTAITENPSQRPAGYGFIGGAGSLFTFGPEGYEFGVPLTIVLSYANVVPEPDPDDLVVVRWSGETMKILEDIVVDTVAKTISVTVTGFSDYGIMENVGVDSIVVSGADSIAIPRSGEDDVTSQYEATVKDVGGNTMTGQEVTWSLAASKEGVSIASDTGIVTITPAAKTGSITVVATSVALPDVKGEKIVEIYNEYILTVEVDGEGTITPSKGQYRYKDGAIPSLIATASSGWTLEKWVVGEAEYSASTINVTMDADKTATAYFLRSGTITIVQDVPAPGGVSEPQGKVGPMGGGDSDPVITLVPEPVGKPDWSKTFHISVDDSTINNISGELTFDSAKVSIGIDDIIAKYGTIIGEVTCTEDEVSGTKTIRFTVVNISGFTGGELITVRAAALDYTDTETGGATVTSTLGLTIDNWYAESVSGATVENYLLGDVDKRYGIKPSDAMETLRFALGLDTFYDVDPILADVNNDLKVTTADALNILRISVGLALQ